MSEPMTSSYNKSIMLPQLTRNSQPYTFYPIPPDRYDVLTGAGLFAESHLNEDCLLEFIRIVKPGKTWWRHQMETFSALLALCVGNSPLPGEFPAQRPVTRSMMFSLICVWINGWVNNREAGDLRRNQTHYNVIVMVDLIKYMYIVSTLSCRYCINGK